ncbi:hypothetical protein, partial [Serratia marcescens]|uniref:hypothetical protein n=1 Tax=Serratia marcescens TaxID=615 RepID=UPI0027E41DA4
MADSYFALGLEALLYHYFTLRCIPVRFLPEQCSGEAQLLFQSKGVSRSRQFCRQYHLGHRQRVITVLDTPRARYYQPPQQPCLSEQSVIEHHIGVKALLLDVERVLALPAEPPPPAQP